MNTPSRRRRDRRKIIPLVTLGVAVALVLSACSGGAGNTESEGTNTLTIGLVNPPASLNPAKNGANGPNIVQWLTYDPLIRLNSDGSFSPALATEWGYSEAGDAFEMTIRTGAKFSDGTPVTADAVAETIEYFIVTPNTLSHFLYGISGATAIDESTVRVTLSSPNPNLETVFSQVWNWGDIISPAGLEDPEQLATDTFGAGAYVLNREDTVDGDHYAFVPNEYYWNPDAQHWDEVVVTVIPDANAALQALQSGQIQISYNTNATLVEQAEASGITALTGPGYVNSVFLLDRAGEYAPALGDVRVRQAINYAIDREAIAKVLGAGYTPTDQVIAPGTDGYDKSLEGTYSYDPDKARSLLEEAGYGDGLDLSMVSVSFLQIDTVGQAVAAQLAEVGIDVNFKSQGTISANMNADLATKDYPTMSYILSGADMFSHSLQNIGLDKTPLNPYKVVDPEVTAAFDTLAQSATESERATAAVALNKTLVDLAWFAPVASTDRLVFMSGVSGGVDSLGKESTLDILSITP